MRQKGEVRNENAMMGVGVGILKWKGNYTKDVLVKNVENNLLC